jgi:hypothetical protein
MLFSSFYSHFMHCFTFYGYFLCIFKSLFCFIVEIGFLAYLRFCKLSKDTDFINIIFRENKAGNLRFISTAPFTHQIFAFFVYLLSLTSTCIKKIHMSK